ncbi:MAG TPA: SCO family protein [Woeseiaceae bacterium]|nr:SCO family protein [Woeseiaceae bacterium]
MTRRLSVFALLGLLPMLAVAAANGATAAPRRAGFDQRLDAPLPGTARFRDARGRTVALGDLLGARPLLILPVYFRCPNLCSLTLAGLAESVSALDLVPGRDFEIAVVSIDPREDSAVAAASRAELARRFPDAGIGAGWHFLTGEAADIASLARSIGFRYARDAGRNQYAHAAGLVIATPAGRISRYLFGVRFPDFDLRLGLVDAASGRIGSLTDHLLLLCYDYDASTGRYTVAIVEVLRLAAGGTALALAAGLAVAFRRERRRSGRR